jgi:hypothetical protein
MTTLTSQQLRQALLLREKIDTLESELAGLFNGGSPRTKAPTRRASWARVKKEKTVAARKPAKRRTMSAAGRAKIAAAARKRWKLAKAAGKTSLAG